MRRQLAIEAGWRSVDFLFMLVIGYVITQSALGAAAIALVDTVTKLVLGGRRWTRNPTKAV